MVNHCFGNVRTILKEIPKPLRKKKKTKGRKMFFKDIPYISSARLGFGLYPIYNCFLQKTHNFAHSKPKNEHDKEYLHLHAPTCRQLLEDLLPKFLLNIQTFSTNEYAHKLPLVYQKKRFQIGSLNFPLSDNKRTVSIWETSVIRASSLS